MSKALTASQELRGTIDNMKGEFKKVLPEHIPVDRFVRVIHTAMNTNKALIEANRQSFLSACMKASESSLLPDGREAALVPYGNAVQFMPMVQGLLKLARNSGKIKNIFAQIVYDADHFDYYVDEEGEHLKHRPCLEDSPGEMSCAYAIAVTTDGGKYIEVMTLKQIEDVESMSKGNKSPWKGKFRTEMIKKTVLRRLCKRLPLSTDLEKNLYIDSYPNDLIDVTPVGRDDVAKEANKPNKLKKILSIPEEPQPESDQDEREVEEVPL